MFGLKDTGKLSWTEILVAGLVPLGQLWARIFKFNGSLDKPWLFFPVFLIPPLSFISLILMKYGFIKDGNGSKPVGYEVLIPIIAKFIIPFILPFMIDNEEGESDTLISIITSIASIFVIVVIMMYRRWVNCESISLNSFGKATIDSVIANGFGNLMPIILGWLPYVGIVVTICEYIFGDLTTNIFWSIGFTAAYAIINMLNQDNMNKYCTSPFFGDIKDRIFAGIAIAISIASNFL
jgi:hypothetical protein